MTAPRTMIIGDGDPSTLAAVCLEPRADQILIWHAARPGANSMRRNKSLEAAGRFFNVHSIIDDAFEPASMFPGGVDPVDDATMLLRAVAIARDQHAERIVWPVCVGPHDLHRLTQITELVLLVVTIARLDGDQPGIRIETPLLDLSADEILDIPRQVGAPAVLAWPCENGGDVPCGRCDWCEFWHLDNPDAHAGVITTRQSETPAPTAKPRLSTGT